MDPNWTTHHDVAGLARSKNKSAKKGGGQENEITGLQRKGIKENRLATER